VVPAVAHGRLLQAYLTSATTGVTPVALAATALFHLH